MMGKSDITLKQSCLPQTSRISPAGLLQLELKLRNYVSNEKIYLQEQKQEQEQEGQPYSH